MAPAPKVRLPILFIWGNHDPAVSRYAVESQRNFIEGQFDYHELNAGHWLMEEATDKVDSEILLFLRAVDEKAAQAQPPEADVMRGLDGRCVIVTGGASGIGRAIVERLAAENASVGVWDINAAAAETVAKTIRTSGGKATPYAVDITDHDGVREAVRQFEQQVGAIAGLVNCAGWDRMARFVDTDPQLWRKVVDINLFGALNVLHAVLPRMVATSSAAS